MFPILFLMPLAGVMLYLSNPVGLLVFVGALVLSVCVFRVHGRGG